MCSTRTGFPTTYRYRTFTVTFIAGPKATQMGTRSPRVRTTRGIGVGSTRAAVLARVPGVRCLVESSYDHCYAGVWEPGRKVTDFAIRNGRVARVTIGYVTD